MARYLNAILAVLVVVSALFAFGLYERAEYYRDRFRVTDQLVRDSRATYDAVCYRNMASQSREWRAACVLAAGHKMQDGQPWFCFSREFSIANGGIGASCAGP